MKSCNAGSLSLHSRVVIDCLSTHGDTITYDNGSIPPYTIGNSYNTPLTAAEVQERKAAANEVLERWKIAARDNASNIRSNTQPDQRMPRATTGANSHQVPASNSSPAEAPTPVDATPERVAGAEYGLADISAIESSYTNNIMRFNRLYEGKSFGFNGFPWFKEQMEDISDGYSVAFNYKMQRRDTLASIFVAPFSVMCANVNDEKKMDRVNRWLSNAAPPRVTVLGTIVDSRGATGSAEAASHVLRLINCTMDGM